MNRYNNNEWDNKGNSSGTIRLVILIFIVFLLFVLTVLILFKTGFFIYLSGSGEPQNLNATIINLPELKNSSFGIVKQFYPDMKFNHNNLSYIIQPDCPIDKKENMIEAFNLISQDVQYINFTQVTDNVSADIEILCSPEQKLDPQKESDFFVAGEGGAKEIIQTGRYGVITRGVILLYGNPQNVIKCNWPNTEVHELIHVFGFNHSLDKKSLMYPYLTSCNQKLDDSIIKEIIRLYSQPNLPDLYFENISAVKKGRYLDFNITIKNSGDVEANNVSYTVIDEGKIVETKELNNLKYGTGIILEVSNLKLYNRDSKQIKIIIDYYNRIDEIDKQNNIAILSF